MKKAFRRSNSTKRSPQSASSDEPQVQQVNHKGSWSTKAGSIPTKSNSAPPKNASSKSTLLPPKGRSDATANNRKAILRNQALKVSQTHVADEWRTVGQHRRMTWLHIEKQNSEADPYNAASVDVLSIEHYYEMLERLYEAFDEILTKSVSVAADALDSDFKHGKLHLQDNQRVLTQEVLNMYEEAFVYGVRCQTLFGSCVTRHPIYYHTIPQDLAFKRRTHLQRVHHVQICMEEICERIDVLAYHLRNQGSSALLPHQDESTTAPSAKDTLKRWCPWTHKIHDNQQQFIISGSFAQSAAGTDLTPVSTKSKPQEDKKEGMVFTRVKAYLSTKDDSAESLSSGNTKSVSLQRSSINNPSASPVSLQEGMDSLKNTIVVVREQIDINDDLTDPRSISPTDSYWNEVRKEEEYHVSEDETAPLKDMDFVMNLAEPKASHRTPRGDTPFSPDDDDDEDDNDILEKPRIIPTRKPASSPIHEDKAMFEEKTFKSGLFFRPISDGSCASEGEVPNEDIPNEEYPDYEPSDFDPFSLNSKQDFAGSFAAASFPPRDAPLQVEESVDEEEMIQEFGSTPLRRMTDEDILGPPSVRRLLTASTSGEGSGHFSFGDGIQSQQQRIRLMSSGEGSSSGVAFVLPKTSFKKTPIEPNQDEYDRAPRQAPSTIHVPNQDMNENFKESWHNKVNVVSPFSSFDDSHAWSAQEDNLNKEPSPLATAATGSQDLEPYSTTSASMDYDARHEIHAAEEHEMILHDIVSGESVFLPPTANGLVQHKSFEAIEDVSRKQSVLREDMKPDTQEEVSVIKKLESGDMYALQRIPSNASRGSLPLTSRATPARRVTPTRDKGNDSTASAQRGKSPSNHFASLISKFESNIKDTPSRIKTSAKMSSSARSQQQIQPSVAADEPPSQWVTPDQPTNKKVPDSPQRSSLPKRSSRTPPRVRTTANPSAALGNSKSIHGTPARTVLPLIARDKMREPQDHRVGVSPSRRQLAQDVANASVNHTIWRNNHNVVHRRVASEVPPMKSKEDLKSQHSQHTMRTATLSSFSTDASDQYNTHDSGFMTSLNQEHNINRSGSWSNNRSRPVKSPMKSPARHNSMTNRPVKLRSSQFVLMKKELDEENTCEI